MSVTGNISYLIDNGYIDGTLISDDIVFRLGSVSTDDFNVLMPKRIVNSVECHFPCKNYSGVQVSFRPVFQREVNLNFIDVMESFVSGFSLFDLVEKIRRAFFLRYGLSLGPIRYWECHVQKNISDAYHYIGNDYRESTNNQKEIELCIEKVIENLLEAGFKSFKKNVGDFMSGVHLGYDRAILNDLPTNFRVFDTSLNMIPGAHPTIRSFCESYNLAYNDFLNSDVLG